jgi:spoIIIJ-associated protein
METTRELVTQVTLELLKYLGSPGEVNCELEQDDKKHPRLVVRITSPDSKRLIGQHGATLQALQHTVRLLVSAKTNKPCLASVDVNGYKQEREDRVVSLAKEMADKAIRTDNMVIMRPMTSFERRIVHTTLQENRSVTTESLGQEPNRRVVVKPLRESRVVSSFKDKGFTLDDIKI